MLTTALQMDIINLFAGRWQLTRFGSPKMYPGDRLMVARRIRDAAGLPDDAPPRHIAYRLGLVPVPAPVPGCGGEVCGHGMILYRPSVWPETEAVRLAHGISHHQLSVEGWDHSEADAWWVTADVLCPANMRRRGEVADHVPRWLADAFERVARS